MKRIYFATTNKDKLAEAREILGLDVLGLEGEIDEIQSLSPEEVAVKKAKAYFDEYKKPLFVEDVSLVFNALNMLPGTYINDFSKALGNGGLVNLLKGKKNKNAIAQTTIVFVDQRGKTHTFVGRVNGKIASKPKGTQGFGWDSIFIPEKESKTFAQMSLKQKNYYSMRAKAFKAFKKWLLKTK